MAHPLRDVGPMKGFVLRGFHVAVPSLLTAGFLVSAAYRILAVDEQGPSWMTLACRPPDLGWLPWHLLLPPALLLEACRRRSATWVLSVQVILLVIAFFDLVWAMGTPPAEKVDPRFVYTAIVAHAAAWGCYLCAAAGLVIELAPRPKPAQESGLVALRPKE